MTPVNAGLMTRPDWVRREIAEALSYGLRVIPILTGGAALPAEADLPADIAGLSRRQHLSLRHRHTPLDLAYLVERITEADSELARLAATGREQVPQQLPAAVTISLVGPVNWPPSPGCCAAGPAPGAQW